MTAEKLVDAASEALAVYHADGSAKILQREQHLNNIAVLPGFNFALEVLFAD